MVLETMAADVAHQTLEFGHLDNGTCAERLERIVGETPLTDIRDDSSVAIIGRDARERHRPSAGSATRERSVGVFFAQKCLPNSREAGGTLRQRLPVHREQAAPGLLSLRLVVDTGIRRTPAVRSALVHFDLGR